MGVSHPETKPWIMSKLIDIAPTTILDVGAGAGIYLNNIREHLGESVEVTAIEIWEPYIEEHNLRSRYNKVIQEDVRNVNDFTYDVVIFGDVLEHMTEEDAVKIWSKVKNQAKYAFIAIPTVHYEQDALFNNPYEVHVEEDWNEERVLSSFSNIIEWEVFSLTGAFLAKFLP